MKALESFENIKQGLSEEIIEHGIKVQQYLEGENPKFDLSVLDFDICSEIQRKVLIAEYNIPRGWVSTYKRIANHIGIKNGARVVGNSLARNPYPIFIPCHRAIKSDGALGGYQGGLEMKRLLLEMEGVEISAKGKVQTDKMYY
jgi:methylated-DNA-[protein]-cysteine S-methyltransferase